MFNVNSHVQTLNAFQGRPVFLIVIADFGDYSCLEHFISDVFSNVIGQHVVQTSSDRPINYPNSAGMLLGLTLGILCLSAMANLHLVCLHKHLPMFM